MGRPKRHDLELVNLRLRKEDVARARREAQRTGRAYQEVIRDWVSRGAVAASDDDTWLVEIERRHAY